MFNIGLIISNDSIKVNEVKGVLPLYEWSSAAATDDRIVAHPLLSNVLPEIKASIHEEGGASYVQSENLSFVKFTWKSDIEYMPCIGVLISRCDKIGSPGNVMPVVATPDGDAVSR